MPALGEKHVRGLADCNRALRKVDRDVRLGFRKELRGVAEPVRADAESLAASEIRNIGPDWSRMRVGQTTDVVYVAPRKRGIKRGAKKRPNLAPLLMDKAMQPALEHNAHLIEDRFGVFVDRVADTFGEG